MNTERKKQKTIENGINDLPDDCLCHILSFLTTKEAIVTSLLSIRWRFLWTMLPSLHIHCSKPIMNSHKSVSTFLNLRKMEKVKDFNLTCNNKDCCCSHYVEEWVCAVVARKVEQLNISLCMNNVDTSVLSFDTLFTCNTLVTLKLQGSFDLSIPSSAHLPNVKTLILHVNTCTPITNVSVLVSGSPSLQLFRLRYKWFWHNILQEYKIVNNRQDIRDFHFFRRVHHRHFILQIDRYYNYTTVVSKYYVTVVSDTACFTNKSVSAILKKLGNVKILSFSYLREEKEDELSTLDLPVFENLVELRLFVRKVDSLFMELLPAKCPKLEALEVHIMNVHSGIDQRYRYHVRDGVRERNLSIVPFRRPKTTFVGRCLQFPCC